jgi:hypothetical protein
VDLLQPITPISEEVIRPYIGQQVCAVLHDGTHLYGTISDCSGGQLYFTNGQQGLGTVSTNSKKAISQIKTKLNDKANVSFTPFFGFGGGATTAAISLGLIAALFAFPFGGFPFFI